MADRTVADIIADECIHDDADLTTLRAMVHENERLRQALERACSDSHEDWRWAVGFYLDMAKRAQDDAALFGSSAGGEQ